jgi:2-succinyl-6-hydroxy-2,4-cyclohexadiene-1-carboxylate synthase
VTRRLVAAGDVRYAVRVAGEGAPVLLLHGFTGTGGAWDPLARRLRADGHRTIAPDLLGHGRSDAPTDPSRHDVARQAADLAAVVATLGAVPADVVGYSLGGRIALRLALDRPDVVRSLVLIGAGAGTADDRERARRRSEDAAFAQAIEREGIPAFVDRWESLPLFASERDLPDRVRAGRRAERMSQRPEGLAASLRGAGQGAQQPLYARLITLRAPTLLVVGERDASARARAEAIAAAAPRKLVRVVVEADTGHAVHLEREARFADLVLCWLSEPTGRRTTVPTAVAGAGVGPRPPALSAGPTDGRDPARPSDARRPDPPATRSTRRTA